MLQRLIIIALVAGWGVLWASLARAEEAEFLVLVQESHVYSVSLDGSVTTMVGRPGQINAQGYTIAQSGEIFLLGGGPERRKRGALRRYALTRAHSVSTDELPETLLPGLSGTRCRNPAACPRRLRIAFASTGPSDDEPEQLHILDLASGSLKQLTSIDWGEAGGPGGVAHRPRWSPEGTEIAFYYAPTAGAFDQENRQQYELYVVDLEGKLTKVAEACRRPGSAHFIPWAGPIWSPDGKTVYFVGNYEKGHNEDGQGEPLTYSVPAVGGALKRVCRGNPTSITPDGRYLFVTGKPPTFGPESHRLRVDLRDGTEVSLGADWSDALVSPSGRYVVGAPPGALVFFTIDSNEIARVDLSKTPLNRGVSLTQGAWWVKQE